MFRVDQSSRIPVPALLSGGRQESSIHTFVEVTNNLPVWILQVLSTAQNEDEIDRWRRFFVRGLSDALALSELPHWSARNLYVLLPAYMTCTDRLSCALCLAVWECEEPDGDELCWRIETDHGVTLESMHGTQPGNERKRHQLWSARGLNDGHACQGGSA